MLSAPVDVHPLDATTSWESSVYLPEDADDPAQSTPVFEYDTSRRHPDVEAKAHSAGEERVRKQTAERSMTAGVSLRPMALPAGAKTPAVETPSAARKPCRDTLAVPTRNDVQRHHHYASHGRSPSLDDMIEEVLSMPVDIHPLDATTSWESSMYLPEDADDPAQSSPVFERDTSRCHPDVEEGLPGQAGSAHRLTHHQTVTD
ncbi:hypothetical protein DL93DRAFT_2092146 [Clavulina sp. PMI_390]|nr:hypothetical protein DL93DRAFT_2092146 [Clavulina sp. PMI_390]